MPICFRPSRLKDLGRLSFSQVRSYPAVALVAAFNQRLRSELGKPREGAFDGVSYGSYSGLRFIVRSAQRFR